MSKNCLKCGTENPDEARFCRSCGLSFDAAAAVPATEPPIAGIICPECNHANRASARFCSKCGTDLTEQTIIAAPIRRPAADAATHPPKTPHTLP